jgi:hypothetical protein
MMIIEWQSDAVQSETAEKLGILIHKKVFQELV